LGFAALGYSSLATPFFAGLEQKRSGFISARMKPIFHQRLDGGAGRTAPRGQKMGYQITFIYVI
jgi:hypothetical protein